MTWEEGSKKLFCLFISDFHKDFADDYGTMLVVTSYGFLETVPFPLQEPAYVPR